MAKQVPITWVIGDFESTALVEQFASSYSSYVHVGIENVEQAINTDLGLPRSPLELRTTLEPRLVILDINHSLAAFTQETVKCILGARSFGVHFLILNAQDLPLVFYPTSFPKQADQIILCPSARNIDRFIDIREANYQLVVAACKSLPPNHCLTVSNLYQQNRNYFCGDISWWGIGPGPQPSYFHLSDPWVPWLRFHSWTTAKHLFYPKRVRDRVWTLLLGQADVNSLLSKLDKECLLKVLEHGAALDSFYVTLSNLTVVLTTPDQVQYWNKDRCIPAAFIHTSHFEEFYENAVKRQIQFLNQAPTKFERLDLIVDMGVPIDTKIATSPLFNLYDVALTVFSSITCPPGIQKFVQAISIPRNLE